MSFKGQSEIAFQTKTLLDNNFNSNYFIRFTLKKQ